MRTKLRGKISLLFMTLGLLAVPAVALADQVLGDVDLVNADAQGSASFTVTSGASFQKTVQFYLDCTGQKHLNPGTTNTMTFSSSQSTKPAGGSLSAEDATITAPSTWPNDNTGCGTRADFLGANTSTVSMTAPSVTSTQTFTYKALWNNSDADIGGNTSVTFTVTVEPDGDGDGVADTTDNCPNDANPGQEDADDDGIGDACDTDNGGGTGGDPCANVTVAAPTFDTSDDADSNGWFNEDEGIPTVSATSAGNTVTYATAASGPFGAAPTLDQGEQTVYAKATDANGCVSAVSSHLYKVDTVDPTITPLGLTNATSTVTGTDANGDDWYNHSVTHQFSAEDATPGSGFAAPNTNPYIIEESSGQQEGRGITFASGPISDVAGNTTASVDSDAFNIDLTRPPLNISGAANGTYDVCSIPSRPTFAPSDALSGLDGSEGDSWTPPSSETGGIGTYTYSAHATDYASNNSSETRTYNVVPDLNYTDTLGPFSGILQPVNMIGNPQRSSFKLGSTVPIKFRVVCGTTPVSGLKVSLWLSRIDGTADPVNEAVATTTGTTGTLFRYDAASGQYIFNLSTKGDYVQPEGQTIAMGQGTWYLSLLFAGTNQKVQVAHIDLKK